MRGEFLAVIFAGLIMGTAGCAKLAKSPAEMRTLPLDIAAYAAPAQRFIAERHKLEVIAPESELQKAWESVITFCGTIQCEVVNSSISAKTRDSAPAGSMSLRVVPGDLDKLFAQVQKVGTVTLHTTEREDKTAAVVDTEAKIKNLTSFRDSLRTMLTKPSATVKDLIEIQKQLTDTQAELDSETAQRKILANETEKVAVEISFHAEKTGGKANGFAEIWNALRNSGAVLGDSTAALITVIVTVIPWLILIVPAMWLLVRAWRRLRRKRGGAQTQTAQSE
jgi:hypothetical protein